MNTTFPYFTDQTWSRVAVVVAHFNPCLYSQREYNLRQTLRTLTHQGLPTFVGAIIPPGVAWDLADDEHKNNVLIFRNRDFLWNRERLINLTVERLIRSNPHFTHVCWMDSDIAMCTDELAEFAENPNAGLGYSNRIGQPFGSIIQLNRLGYPGKAVQTATKLEDGETIDSARLLARSTGGGWIAPVNFWDYCGLFRFAMRGKADALMLASLTNRMDDHLLATYVGAFQDMWFEHTQALKRWCDTLDANMIFNLGGTALKSWLGSAPSAMSGRDIQQASLKPADLIVDDGILRWSSTASSGLQALHRQSFMQRREDTAT